MKNPFLFGIAWITLVAVTATTLYAQTTTGTSIIDKMKAAVHTFTLATGLNPGQTGLQSAPLVGKKTGDILTAGEWNRVLELLSEGASGSDVGWTDVPVTDTAPFDIDCQYRFRTSGLAGNSVIPGFSQTHWYEGTYKSADAIASAGWYYFRSNNKQTLYGINTSNNDVWNATTLLGAKVTNIQKKCGDSVSATTAWAVRPSSIDSSDRWPATFLAAFDQCKSEGKYLPTAEEALYFVFGGGGTFQNPSSNALWTITPDDNRNTFVTVYSGNTGWDPMDHTGALSTPYSLTATAHYRCVSGSDSWSSSGWIDVPLTDTNLFDKTCEYRFHMNAMWLDAVYYAGAVAANQIVYVSHSSVTSSIPASNKSSYQVNGTPLYTVSKIEKRCN